MRRTAFASAEGSGPATFDLTSWTGTGGTAYSISVAAGVLSSTQPGGGIY
jgi:hypothetical protein